MHVSTASHAVLVSGFLLLSSHAIAADAEGLTGDWNGRRTAWAARGVQVDAGYTTEGAGNLRGGDRHTVARAGALTFGSRFDLERLWGRRGLRASVSFSLRDGDDLNARAGLGALLSNQEIHGRGHITRLGDLWLGWAAPDGALDIKVGRLSVGDDFNRLACDAIHLAFCGSQPAIFAGDYWYNSPVSQWGAVVGVVPAPQWYVRAGVYQVNPAYTNTRAGGLRLAPSGTQGTLTPLELGWEPRLSGLQGHYALGGWYSSAPRADADPLQHRVGRDLTDGIAPLMRAGAYGGWFSAQQQFTRAADGDESKGMRVQFAYAQGDQRTGQIDRMVNLIGTWTGLAAARPQDQLGLGIGATHVNARAARFQQATGQGAPANDEYVAELFYRWQAQPAIALQPALQYIRHPGGVSTATDAVVAALRLSLAF